MKKIIMKSPGEFLLADFISHYYFTNKLTSFLE